MAAMPAAPRDVMAQWRTGLKLGRTVYLDEGEGTLIGVFNTRELATEAVEAHNEIARLRAELREANEIGARQHRVPAHLLDAAQAEVARLTREIVEIERFRAASLNTIRKLLGDHESPDEAIAGSVCAVLVTRQETVRRKQAAEKECDALRACVTQLVEALRVVEERCELGGLAPEVREALLAAEVARQKAIIENPALLQWVPAHLLDAAQAEVARLLEQVQDTEARLDRALTVAQIHMEARLHPEDEVARLTRTEGMERAKRQATETLMRDACERHDALRACVTQLVEALRPFVKKDIEDPYAPVKEGEAIAARAALAAAEKLLNP